jgi:hypothetical protein
VIIDNASNYVVAGRMLEEKLPMIWCTPCETHCLDLLLEDIGKIEWVKKCVEEEKFLTRYIYKHTSILKLMRKHNGGREIVWSDITQFSKKNISLKYTIQQKTNI